MTTKAAIPLSEAIALGRTLTRPCRGGRTLSGGGFGCALDMALDAIGRFGNWTVTHRYWPWLREFSDGKDSWMLTIANKFDEEVMIRQTMTMDAFIDWVREIEGKYEVEGEVAAPSVVPCDEKVVA